MLEIEELSEVAEDKNCNDNNFVFDAAILLSEGGLYRVEAETAVSGPLGKIRKGAGNKSCSREECAANRELGGVE